MSMLQRSLRAHWLLNEELAPPLVGKVQSQTQHGHWPIKNEIYEPKGVYSKP